MYLEELFLCLLCILLPSSTPIELSELLEELSWNLKLKLLNDTVPKYPTTTDIYSGLQLFTRTPKPSIPSLPTPEYPPHVELPASPPENEQKSRRADLEPYGQEKRRQNRQRTPPPSGPEPPKSPNDPSSDDNDMRMKLFRLMYETVRDSDLKVKRAELIREHYVNSSAFEIGYLLGDITDKNSVMKDISKTLQKFYRDWKPIEHINAYEQISNQAIEISHLVDLIKIVNKKETATTKSPA